MKKILSLSLLPFSMVTLADAAITLYGDGTGYDSTSKDWLTLNTTGDSNGLGTDGYIFFGDFVESGTALQINPGNENPGQDGNQNIIGTNAGTQTSDSGGPQFTVSGPSYVTWAQTTSNSGNVGQFAGYEPIDSPVLGDGTDATAGNLLVTGSGSAVEFNVFGLATGQVVRIGILGAVLNDDNRARFDAPTISLTDGTSTESVIGLPNLSDGTAAASLGWVFFDIDADGTYGVAVPPDAAGTDPDVTGLGGITFDTIVVPEPSSFALIGGCLALGAVMLRRRS